MTELTKEEQRKIVRSSLTQLELTMFQQLREMMGARMVYFNDGEHEFGQPDEFDREENERAKRLREDVQ